MKKPLKMPKFMSEDEERKYWYNLDLTEYFDSGDFQHASFPNLKPTSTPISLRIPNIWLNQVKEKANLMGIPYQSLMKQYIQQGISSQSA